MEKPIENLDLPKNFTIEVDDRNSIDPKDFDVSNILSDEYGYCVDGFDEIRWMEDGEEID